MSNFYSMLLRMKYINRWGLMRNTRQETLSEHCLDVSVIAHALGIIANKRLGKNVDENMLAVIALFHDASEIITGDLPTPVKYYNGDITTAFKNIESQADRALIEMLPDDLKPSYEDIFFKFTQDEELKKLLKAADKISALIKCIEEEQSGNKEFSKAKLSTENAIKALNCPEADIFTAEFIPSFYLTLDEQ